MPLIRINVNYGTTEEILTDYETQPLWFDHSGYVAIQFDSFLMVLREEVKSNFSRERKLKSI